MRSLTGDSPFFSWQFWKGETTKIWMPSKFFEATVFITKCDKKSSYTPFGRFYKKLLSVTNRDIFTNFKTIISKFETKWLLSVTYVIKCGGCYKVTLWCWCSGVFLDQKYPFWAALVHKFKIVFVKRNFVHRLLRIWGIR